MVAKRLIVQFLKGEKIKKLLILRWLNTPIRSCSEELVTYDDSQGEGRRLDCRSILQQPGSREETWSRQSTLNNRQHSQPLRWTPPEQRETQHGIQQFQKPSIGNKSTVQSKSRRRIRRPERHFTTE